MPVDSSSRNTLLASIRLLSIKSFGRFYGKCGHLAIFNPCNLHSRTVAEEVLYLGKNLRGVTKGLCHRGEGEKTNL